MRLSGFTFVRNAVRYQYPLVESIRSILPIVDEFVVNVGRCDDGTLQLVRSVTDPKIRIIESIWDENLRRDGLIYSQQTNIALSHCTGDWAFYLQADEVIHERDLPQILEALTRNHRNPAVRGLLFRYLHFVGDYWSLNPWFYHRAVRIIRNNGEIDAETRSAFISKRPASIFKAGRVTGLHSQELGSFTMGGSRTPRLCWQKSRNRPRSTTVRRRLAPKRDCTIRTPSPLKTIGF